MSKPLPDFDMDEIYNMAFNHIMQLLEKNRIGDAHEIWLHEGVTPNHYGFTSIPTRSTGWAKNTKPIHVICTWVSNYNDAGRILRRMVETCVEHERRLSADSKGSEKPKNEPLAQDTAKPDKEPQTPGVG